MAEPRHPRRLLDAEVVYAPVPDPATVGWESLTPTSRFVADGDTVWFLTDELRIMVRGTREVLVDLAPGADESVVDHLLYGWATRILQLHAGVFSLHASVVRLDDRTVAIGGHSGAGKSTTVAALSLRYGARLVIDDVVPVRLVDGEPIVVPFPRPVNLMLDALERVGLGDQGARIGDGPYQKRAVELDAMAEPVRLDQLVGLVGWDPDPHEDWPNTVEPVVRPSAERPVVTTPVNGAERLRWIARLSNNQGLATYGGRTGAFLEWSTAVANVVPVVEIARLRSADTLDEVCRQIVAGTAH